MLFTAFLQETFRRLQGCCAAQGEAATQQGVDDELLDRAVEHVVDETYNRLRLLPGYAGRLRGLVQESFRYIDGLVEALPDAIQCCRSTYVEDPRVNAFFASPQQMCEVFSRSEDVRSLFEGAPDAVECWALLCMRKEERRSFGMALVGDDVRKDVMQVGVSFGDHQVVSPGITEGDARRALKCCIFNHLLSYIRRRAKTAKETRGELENRRRVLQGRLQRAAPEGALALQSQIADVERDLALEDLQLNSLEDHMEFIAGVLGNPQLYVSGAGMSLRLSRLGIKMDVDSGEAGYTVPLSEIRVSCHEPRIATLVRFPRSELLPQQDYLERADRFLGA
jgi:hypothetical protein